MKRLILIFILLLSCVYFTGCSRVDTGDIGIGKGSFSGKIESDYYDQGFYFTPLTSLTRVDATEVRIEFNDLTPKDSNNIKFRDVDLTIPFKIKKEKAIEFYKKTKEIDVVQQNNDKKTRVLGYRKVKNKLKSVIVKSFAKYKYQDFISDRTELEETIKKLSQKAVDNIIPDTFIIGDVDTTTINLDESVEMALQDKALIAMKKKLLIDRKDLMLKEMEIQDLELSKLKQNAKNAGISLKDLMDYCIRQERNSVLSELAKSNSNTQIQIRQ